MAKKFDSVLSALEAVHGNTEKTNQILAAQMKLDKDQEDRARRDKIAADQKDKSKPMPSIIKASGLSGTASKAGNSLLDFAKLTAGLAGIELLMRNIEAIKDGLQDVVQTMRGLGIIKTAADVKRFTGNRGSGVDPETGETGRQKRARLKKEAAARAKAMAASNAFGDIEAQADAARAEAEQKRIKTKQAKLNADIQKTTSGLTLDDIVYDEKSKQYRNKQYGGYVKKDIVKQLKLLDLETNKPKISKSTPKPVAIDPDIGDPRNAPSAKGRSGFLKVAQTANAIARSIPGSGLVRGGLKVAGPVGTAFSVKAGLQNQGLQEAGYGDVSRSMAQLGMDVIDVGDGIVNLGTAIKSVVSGKGPTLENDIDMSGAVQSYLEREGVAAGFKTGLGMVPGLESLMNADLGLKQAADSLDKTTEKAFNFLGMHKDDQARYADIQKYQTVYSRELNRALRDGYIDERENARMIQIVESIQALILKMDQQSQAPIVSQVNNSNTLLPSHQLQIETADLD